MAESDTKQRVSDLIDAMLTWTDLYMADQDNVPGETARQVMARREADTIRAELRDMGFGDLADKFADATPEAKRAAADEWYAQQRTSGGRSGAQPPESGGWLAPIGEFVGGVTDKIAGGIDSGKTIVGVAALAAGLILLSILFGGRR